MAMRPANDKELLDHEQVDNYVRHIQDLYKMRGTACFRKMLIPETKPCTFSLNQIEEYGKAEKTDKMIYVLVDLGNPIKIQKLIELHDRKVDEGLDCPEVVIIDSTKKESASNA